MQRVKGNSNMEEKGVRGLAEVIKLSDENLRVDFEDNKGSFNIKVEEDSIPESFPFKVMKKDGKIKVSVTMNKDGNKILFAVPASGEYEAKFDKMVAAEGQEPVAETKQGKKGKPYKQFAVLIEVLDKRWSGARYWYPMYPNFGQDEDGNLAVAGSGSGSDALFDFLEATGVSQHLIPFSENPLPEIQRIAQAEEKTFKIIVNKGWIDMIVVPMNVDDAFGGDEEIGFTEQQKDNVHPALVE